MLVKDIAKRENITIEEAVAFFNEMAKYSNPSYNQESET